LRELVNVFAVILISENYANFIDFNFFRALQLKFLCGLSS
jgi:hypothetical protein